MDTITLVIQIIAALGGLVVAAMSISVLIRVHWPSPVMWSLKLCASALSLLFALVGAVITIVGLTTGSALISALGIYDLLFFSIHRFRITRPPDRASSFEVAFGSNWENRIASEQRKYFLPKRTAWRLPKVPVSRLQQNMAFSTIPGTQRQLLCDFWQPPKNISPSGLAFIYLHGSAWYFLDKDLGTRPFFGHLAAQGHVIMDVAYRLAPETDLMGMVHDTKRAIAWMKENCAMYGVDPKQIVVGGGSAGGHLGLLAAYTEGDPLFIPPELEGKDTGVCAVISMYGPADLERMYYHTNQHLTTRETPGRPKKPVPTEMPKWLVKKMGKEFYRLGFDKGFVNAGNFAPLMGGHPDECPQTYAFFSPVTHVHSNCPPTFLIHGEHDVMAPVKSTHDLYRRLAQEKAQVVMHILPQTDHAFDLIMPKLSPSAHNAIYDVERFLALLVKGSDNEGLEVGTTKELQLNY
ncbi:MAG: alpha/beta hydrolase [Bacteroidota bacterium]|nr:alpha/beta hydrolase [Bacteroidota bacterium]MDP4229542.1 alpha/beta hydrolase [Bacteroidota bacterium]MDP4235121.1 alpha/beta hydrolase [Bacteroidota bacterium]